jgi:hypothetical protein
MPKAIEHITITTGASRMSPRAEVNTGVMDIVRADMAAGRPLMGTEWRYHPLPTPAGGSAYDLTHDGTPIARCWLCIDPAVSDDMWEAASAAPLDERVRLTRPRAAPWLAAALRPEAVPAVMKAPAILVEAGDLERVVAWILLDW